METIIITLTLLVPPASQGILWTMGEVQNQIQVTFPNGTQASYSAFRAPCSATADKGRTMYKTKEACYMANTDYPDFVRSPWVPAMNKTYKHKEN